MWNDGSGIGGAGLLLFVGAVLGGLAIGLVWAFVVYVWPWLKGWLHAITA